MHYTCVNSKLRFHMCFERAFETEKDSYSNETNLFIILISSCYIIFSMLLQDTQLLSSIYLTLAKVPDALVPGCSKLSINLRFD